MSKPAAKPTVRPDPLAGWIDELGDVQKTLAPQRSLIEREKALKAAIRDRYEGESATQTFLPEGARYVAALGEKALERRITSLAKVFTVLRKVAFLKYCGMTLKNLEAAADAANCPELLTDVVTQERTGCRSLKVVEKGQPAKGRAS